MPLPVADLRPLRPAEGRRRGAGDRQPRRACRRPSPTASSARTSRQQLGIAPLEDFIQTDAPINFGNSGGALVDATRRAGRHQHRHRRQEHRRRGHRLCDPGQHGARGAGRDHRARPRRSAAGSASCPRTSPTSRRSSSALRRPASSSATCTWAARRSRRACCPGTCSRPSTARPRTARRMRSGASPATSPAAPCVLRGLRGGRTFEVRAQVGERPRPPLMTTLTTRTFRCARRARCGARRARSGARAQRPGRLGGHARRAARRPCPPTARSRAGPLRHDDRLHVLFSDERYVPAGSAGEQLLPGARAAGRARAAGESLLRVRTQLPLAGGRRAPTSASSRAPELRGAHRARTPGARRRRAHRLAL